MHIVVCMKQVPDTSEVRIDPETNTLIREGVPSVINPYDLHALEAALEIKDSRETFITVVTMGPPMASEILKKASGYGADRGILLSDRKFAGADTLATSYALAEAVKKIDSERKVDLILCGKQAVDGDTAQVGPQMAARLRYPLAAYAEKLEVREDGCIRVTRKTASGQEIVEMPFPAAVTVSGGVNAIRYESLPDLIRAARFKIETWTAADMEMDEDQLGLNGSPTMVRRIFAPDTVHEGQTKQFDLENPDESIGWLVDSLVPGNIIPG